MIVLFCCGILVVAFVTFDVELYNVEFVIVVLELDGGSPVCVNVMCIIMLPLFALLGIVIVPEEMFAIQGPEMNPEALDSKLCVVLLNTSD